MIDSTKQTAFFSGCILVSALAGLDVMKRAYAHAIRSGYRFYSYGDASLIERSA